MATEYHEHNTKQRFGSNNPELLRERKLNENICFELFVGDLHEKLLSVGYKRERNKKQSRTVRGADKLSILFTAWPSSRTS